MNKNRIAFRMAASGDDVTDLYIDGVIGVDFDWNTWEEIKENTIEVFREKLVAVKTSKINVWINSGGGDARHGVSIHDALKAHPAQVTTITSGFTASAATIIAQAGEVRKMSETSLYLVHKCTGLLFGWYNENDLKLELEDNQAVDKLAVKVYTTGENRPSEEEVRELMDRANGRGVWLTAEEALEAKLIDEIYVPGEDSREGAEAQSDDEKETQQSSKSPAKELLSEAQRMQELGLPPVPEDKTKQLLEVQAAGRKRQLEVQKLKNQIS